MRIQIFLVALCVGTVAACAAAEPGVTTGASVPTQPTKGPVPIILSVRSADGKDVPYGKVYGDFDKPPIPMVQASADYPANLMAKGVQGAAVVKFTISAKGETKDFSTQSSHDEFGSAALAAAKRNKYKPAEKAGKRVECTMNLLYTFPGPYVTQGTPR